ncbi:MULTISPECIES: hypothetical protein [unclassified Enterococcus]|uniref:hypothetical protein n=1 Tax=unclassified Enterococcus TaxID=2608891 RepID=UPI001CE0AF49|nr:MULTISPECIES: hypothetical protein [unclassified Enterococcus]MCA5011749.1 hypothetical protein [Enterococcus sp. S23]MCA5014809.1 hypothetical protein [Enterococcus sp. S22(2020)]
MRKGMENLTEKEKLELVKKVIEEVNKEKSIFINFLNIIVKIAGYMGVISLICHVITTFIMILFRRTGAIEESMSFLSDLAVKMALIFFFIAIISYSIKFIVRLKKKEKVLTRLLENSKTSDQ